MIDIDISGHIIKATYHRYRTAKVWWFMKMEGSEARELMVHLNELANPSSVLDNHIVIEVEFATVGTVSFWWSDHVLYIGKLHMERNYD
jgi:hypothetical protein